jgi:predicted amidohydrolase YtcJ
MFERCLATIVALTTASFAACAVPASAGSGGGVLVNARLALGSDFPVESADPRLGLHAAVTCQDLDGEPPGGWLPDQKLTPAEALRGFTTDAAWAGFMENEVGRLAPGLRADFVLLDADPLGVPARRLPDIKVLSTWVDGQRVYDSRP